MSGASPGHLRRFLPELYGADPLLLRLVDLLELPCEELSRRIDRLADLYGPACAPEERLDFLARLVGLPNDAGLFTPAQLRRLIPRAAGLQRRKGTRAAMETLLNIVLEELCGEPVALRIVEWQDWAALPRGVEEACRNTPRGEDAFAVVIGYHPRLRGRQPMLEALAREYAPAFARTQVVLIRGEARPDSGCYLDCNCYL